ncbi:MAG: hypothetical protein C4527_13155 [Candidatus Omnitrophota bacterium]|jgi:hypothetical protein|nr:MAG: hypothetical protein C4527_13155 [Candidatus Omnitrophota bacterium]
MQRMIHWIAFRFIKLILLLRQHDFLTWLILRASTFRRAQESSNPISTITLLALSHTRFVKDLDALSQSGEVDIVLFPYYFQCALRSVFIPSSVHQPITFQTFFDPTPDSSIFRERRIYREFLTIFLPKLFSRLKVDAVITASVWYPQDHDIAVVADQLGYPYFAFHKENLISSKGHQNVVCNHFRQMGHFEGTMVIVHNVNMKKMLIQSGYVTENQVMALGCLRMDSFIQKVLSAQNRSEDQRVPCKEKQIVFFSFHRATGLWGLAARFPKDKTTGLSHFFNRVHVTIARFAAKHPDVSVVIKTKWGGQWFVAIRESLQEDGLELDQIPNLILTDATPAQALIQNSQVVVSYGSTTLLEAAVAGKPVIMPFFGEATKPEYQDYVQFADEMDLFDVANNEEELEFLLEERLQTYTVDPELQKRRLAAFEYHVSPVSDSAVQRYIQVIRSRILEKNSQRWERENAIPPKDAMKSDRCIFN